MLYKQTANLVELSGLVVQYAGGNVSTKQMRDMKVMGANELFLFTRLRIALNFMCLNLFGFYEFSIKYITQQNYHLIVLLPFA